MSDSERLGVVDLAHKFIHGKENITREEIRNFAKDLARKYKECQASAPERMMLIIDELSDNRLNALLPERVNKPKTRKGREVNKLIDLAGSPEGLDALENLRKAVLYELAGEIEPADFWMITANVLGGRSVKNFVVGYGGKEAFLRQHDFFDEPEAMGPHSVAIERYAALPESPYLLPIKNYEPTVGGYKTVVVPERDFFSLEQLVNVVDLEKREHAPQISFDDFLSAILGAAKGIKILKDNGLMLTDICLNNIGWDKKQRNGLLFDLDSLYEVGSKVKRISQKDYFVQEQETGVPSEIAASEMVFQLGVSLGGFMLPYMKSLPRDFAMRVVQFSQKLMANTPEGRPTIEEAIDGLEKIIADYPEGKQLPLL